MEIPLNANVECTDGPCGQSVCVLVNPVSNRVTHLVVKEESPSGNEMIVPVESVNETISGTILLRINKAEFKKLDPFIQTTVIQQTVPDQVYGYAGGMYGMGSYYYLPYVTPDRTIYETVEFQQVPPGELAVQRGMPINATDGSIGKVDEFVVDPASGHISHMVMREGHLWGQRDVIIPVSAIQTVESDVVYLNLARGEVESLPTFPLHRHWA